MTKFEVIKPFAIEGQPPHEVGAIIELDEAVSVPFVEDGSIKPVPPAEPPEEPKEKAPENEPEPDEMLKAKPGEMDENPAPTPEPTPPADVPPTPQPAPEKAPEPTPAPVATPEPEPVPEKSWVGGHTVGVVNPVARKSAL